LLLAALAVHLAGCAPRAVDAGSAVAADPFDLFRDVCGRVGEPSDSLRLAIETRGFRSAQAAIAPRFLHGRSGRVWVDRRNGESVFIALQQRGAVCTVAARRADVGLTLQRFSEYVLGQAAPDRTIARAVEQEPVDDGRPVRASFRVTPRPSGAPIAYAFLYTFLGDPSATADAQVILRAQLAPYPP